MKSVLISIQPKWCELIASGKKTVEVRKTKPKLETPFKVYIYCTRNKRQWLRKVNTFVREIFITENRDVIGRTDKVKSLIGECTTFVENGGYNGKVIGEFVCDKIIQYPKGCNIAWLMLKSCLNYNNLQYYRGDDLKTIFAWHISNLVIYDKPKELSEFKKHNRECWYADLGLAKRDCPECQNKECFITRPPQSWCYVESEDSYA